MESTLGRFGLLPAELRARVYWHMFAGQLIHCCSSDKKPGGGGGTYHLIGQPTVVDAEAQRYAFDQECLTCCESDYISFCRPVRWEPASCSVDHNPLEPRDAVNFFLTCRTFWREADPAFWSHATFCIGLPQFNAFHDRFLSLPRRRHPDDPRPRGRLVQSLRLVLPDPRRLANKMGHDYNFSHLSPYFCVLDAWEAAARKLGSELPALRHVTAVVSASLVATARPTGDLPLTAQILSADAINALLHLRRAANLSGLSVEYVGTAEVEYYEGSMVGSPVRVNVKSLPRNDPLARRLRALGCGLKDVVVTTRRPAPPDDDPGGSTEEEKAAAAATRTEKWNGVSTEMGEVLMAELEDRVQKYLQES